MGTSTLVSPFPAFELPFNCFTPAGVMALIGERGLPAERAEYGVKGDEEPELEPINYEDVSNGMLVRAV